MLRRLNITMQNALPLCVGGHSYRGGYPASWRAMTNR